MGKSEATGRFPRRMQTVPGPGRKRILYLKLRDDMHARVVWRSAQFGAACYKVDKRVGREPWKAPRFQETQVTREASCWSETGVVVVAWAPPRQGRQRRTHPHTVDAYTVDRLLHTHICTNRRRKGHQVARAVVGGRSAAEVEDTHMRTYTQAAGKARAGQAGAGHRRGPR